MDVSTALHHLENPGTSVRLLFIDSSSAFDTIIPDILVVKLVGLGFPSTTCAWIKDLLTTHGLLELVTRTHTLMLSADSPQGCALSPLLYTSASD